MVRAGREARLPVYKVFDRALSFSSFQKRKRTQRLHKSKIGPYEGHAPKTSKLAGCGPIIFLKIW
jgi:hypothetical protein